MYPTHFELDRPLFPAGIAQDETMLVGDPTAHADLMTHARIALSTPDAAVVLLGPPGVGKTTQAGAALRAASGSARSTTVWLRTPPSTAHELLESLLVELGHEPYKQSRAERLQAWRQTLVELSATDTRLFVALERANEAEIAVLRALDALTAPDPHGCAGANLILMGPGAFRQTLGHPELRGLRQRVRLVREIEPLDASGVAAYLRAAVERAGGAFERIFAEDAIDALASLSDGIPRLLNHLTDSALALAALRGESVLTGSLVREVATDIYGLGHELDTTAGNADLRTGENGEADARAAGHEETLATCDEEALGTYDEAGPGTHGHENNSSAPACEEIPSTDEDENLGNDGDEGIGNYHEERLGAYDDARGPDTYDAEESPDAHDDSALLSDAVSAAADEPLDDPTADATAPAIVDALGETMSVELDGEPAWAETAVEEIESDFFDPAGSPSEAVADEIPVLTDWIDDRPESQDHDDLDMLDAVETLTLLGDDMMDLFAAERETKWRPAAEPDAEPSDSPEERRVTMR